MGKVDGKIADSALREEILTHNMNDRAFGLTVRRTGEESKSTKAPSFVSSMFKLYGTEQNKTRYEPHVSGCDQRNNREQSGHIYLHCFLHRLRSRVRF